MIYFIIILMSSSFSVYSYYATNTVVIEECTKGAINRLNTFESAKMRCLNSTWRQGTITLEYSCTGNQLKREWTMRTTVNQGAQWPQDVFILTSTGFKLFGKVVNQQNLIMDEYPSTFDANHNQFISYLWTGLPSGPQCRFKYTVTKDICIKTNGMKLGAKFTDSICYYGKQSFTFDVAKDKDAFNNLVDGNTKPGSATTQKNSLTTRKPNTSGQKDPNLSGSNPDANALGKKNNQSMFIIGGVVAVIIIIIAAIIGVIIYRRRKPVEVLEEPRISVDSDLE